MIFAALFVCAVVGLGLLYAWALVQSRNGRTRVTMHADAHARPSAQLFPAWLVQAGRRTRLATILFDETFVPHPLLLNGHAQTSEIDSKIAGEFLRNCPRED
jgi:hypothetical protein